MKPFFKIASLFCGLAFGLSAQAQVNTGWTLIWFDEFAQTNGSSPDSTKWAYDIGIGPGSDGWGNNELEYYTSLANNVRIENGQLVIEARKENYMGRAYTSARLKTQGKVSWTYGRIEARIKIPRGQGIWPAFWMLGTNIPSAGWPLCGEIDIMENIGAEPTIVHGTVHGPGYSGGNGIGGPYSLPGNPVFADDFHVYAVEWTTNQFKWFVDGTQFFSVTPGSLPGGATWVFANPEFLLLNVAVGGYWPGNPDGTTVFPQRMTVDYVRVYAPTNLPTCSGDALANPGFENGGLANWNKYGGNTYLENISNVPVHNGTNVFKVYGAFNGQDNYSGVFQDLAITPGQSFSADGWALTRSTDAIAGANSAWLEVSFRNSGANTLALYRSAVITASSPTGAWLNLPITNQLDPATFTSLGSVTNLIAPAGTSLVRYQVVFRQPAMAGGSVLFDDLKLTAAGGSEFPVDASIGWAGTNLGIAFGTYLALPYQVRFKTNLTDPDWLVLTNLTGNGSVQSVAIDPESASRFYQVVRLCD